VECAGYGLAIVINIYGEYLSLMASTEYSLTFLIAETLEVGFKYEEFERWLIEAPIPFNAKVALFGNTQVSEHPRLGEL
jgi:hypothetical protein